MHSGCVVTHASSNMLAYYNSKLLKWARGSSASRFKFEEGSELLELIKASFPRDVDLPPPPPRPIVFDLHAEKLKVQAQKQKRKREMEGKVKAYREQLWLLEHGGFNPVPIVMPPDLRAYLVEKGMINLQTNTPLLEPLEPPKRRRRWMRG